MWPAHIVEQRTVGHECDLVSWDWGYTQRLCNEIFNRCFFILFKKFEVLESCTHMGLKRITLLWISICCDTDMDPGSASASTRIRIHGEKNRLGIFFSKVYMENIILLVNF